MWTFLALMAPAFAECPRTTDNVALSEGLDRALKALEAGEAEGFQDNVALARLSLECMAEPIRPKLAAGFHRLRGIVDYSAGDEGLAAAHFLAARRIEPDVGLPVYPREHDIQTTWRRIAPSESPSHLERPDGGTHYVDGVPDGPVDPRAIHILQVGSTTGSPLELLILQPGELPPWVEPPPEGLGRLSKPFLAGGGALLAVSAGMLAVNLLTANQFHDTTRNTSLDQLGSLRKRANATGAVAVISGVAGAGLLATGVVIR